MNGYERMMIDKIEALERKVVTARRYCETEEETHRNNVDFRSDKGFQYYTAEIQKIPDRKDREIIAVERKRDTFVASKQSMIDKLQMEINICNERATNEIETIGAKYNSQVEEYIAKTNSIQESLSQPTGKVYLRNKETIGILEKEIAEARRGMDEILEQERARRRASALAEMKREIAEAERRAEEERLRALEIKKEERIAIEAGKQARRDALRKEREQEVLEELENLEKTQNLVLGK
jgi:hypothetical protein